MNRLFREEKKNGYILLVFYIKEFIVSKTITKRLFQHQQTVLALFVVTNQNCKVL